MDTAKKSEAMGTTVETKPAQATEQPQLKNKPAERSDASIPRIIVSDNLNLPGVRGASVTLDMTKPVDENLNIDKDTVVYLIYLLFKTNMIARNNLRNMIDQISKPLPDNVLKWLVNEAAKAGR